MAAKSLNFRKRSWYKFNDSFVWKRILDKMPLDRDVHIGMMSTVNSSEYVGYNQTFSYVCLECSSNPFLFLNLETKTILLANKVIMFLLHSCIKHIIITIKSRFQMPKIFKNLRFEAKRYELLYERWKSVWKLRDFSGKLRFACYRGGLKRHRNKRSFRNYSVFDTVQRY